MFLLSLLLLLFTINECPHTLQNTIYMQSVCFENNMGGAIK
ncbi:hypothetical protein VCHA38P217_40081 [Vibrio chagasii]|nr:hypothetical protein VCHA34P115_110145 [Vibrio chagasii]CAH6835750.1 hypothetical protein VCHA36O157_10144 [Vibrio chagasii]CAH6981857.1 hypothetical protein VCHA34P120_40083 [Vibrio chagasii]CAH7016140.1 hypothetical protein VCHA28FP16_50147 [Vibrio chagasii]CAH7059923.1 hypothetical protein VCHA43O270_10452 [Vibrio chagasii]